MKLKVHPPKPHPPKHKKPHPAGHDKPEGKKARHLRRCYEHLARVDALLAVVQADAKLAKTTACTREMALQQLRLDMDSPESVKAAAELARATEHIAFATIVQHAPKRITWDKEIEAAFHHEYDVLVEEAMDVVEEHHAPQEVADLIECMLREAEGLRESRNFAGALECARAAEALAEAAHHLGHLEEELQAA